MDSSAHRLARGRDAILSQFRSDVLYMYAKVGEKFHSKSERVRPVQYRVRYCTGAPFSEVVLKENVYPVTNARQKAFVISAPAQIVKPE
jgi:hypothetical protein